MSSAPVQFPLEQSGGYLHYGDGLIRAVSYAAMAGTQLGHQNWTSLVH